MYPSTENTINPGLSSLMRAVPGCHLFLNADAPRFTILEATDAYLQATLLDRAIIGKGIFDVFTDKPSFNHSSSMKSLSASLLWAMDHKLVHQMDLQRCEMPAQQKDHFALRVWKPVNKPVLDAAGEVHYLIHSLEDVTNQVQLAASEQQAQSNLADASIQLEQQRQLTSTILTASLNGIYALEGVRDPEGQITDFRYLFANEAIAHYLNLNVRDIVGLRVLELIPENKTNGFFDYFCGILEKGQPDRRQIYFASESFKGWFDFTIIPISNDVLIVTTQDITEIKESQLQLEHTVEELKRSNQKLEEFAYAASHDLKEPIRKIRFFTDLLKGQLNGQLKDNELRSLVKIENASERMGGLIEDLLLYSQVSVRPQEKEQVDLEEQLQRILEDLELDIREKGAIIQIGTLPLVPGYRRQLQQLFQNLVSNALKYNREGIAPEITITARESAYEGKQYEVIEIRDNGIGFDQQYSEKIFQMFTRLHGKNQYSGTGVGLSIAKKVAENHDGFIKATSQPLEGATFSVYLPRA